MTAYLITFRPETESPKEGASLPELLRRARESAARKPIVEAWLVAGAGFEPATFGL